MNADKMWTDDLKNGGKTLTAALVALAISMPSLPRFATTRRPTTDSGRKKTKKGATHIVGPQFIPKFLIYADGKPVTPSMYARMHLGVQNPRKKNGLKPAV
jgi:hypothetical protein